MSERICTFCETASPNDFLHDLNHREIFDGGLCISQDLALSHLAYEITHPSDLFERDKREARVRELRCELQARERGLIQDDDSPTQAA